jgi:hypothetical protein
MKALLITLSFGFLFLSINAQTVSVVDTKFKDVATTATKNASEEKVNLVQYTLTQLGDSIMHNLKKDALLQKNYEDLSLILNLKIDETGTIYSYEVDDSNSTVMSKIVLDIINKVNLINVENMNIKGLTTLKIPVQYSH